jgi:hypothetical protein
MSLSSGFPPIPNSITNSIVVDKNVIDNDAPISFVKFKTIIGYYNDNNIEEYYTDYIRKWNGTKKSENVFQSDEILERYKNFIREIAINYNTIEEKQFFESIDFDDNLQLEMSIPFFTEKIKTISNYYKGKREEIKLQTTKNKSLGIEIDLKNKIKDFTINFIENLPDSSIKYDISNIKENLYVEIEELFDSYPLYFDQLPDSSVYDYKDLDYGLDIFLRDNQDLINEVFVGVSEELRTLKETATLFDLKRKETAKNISSNFYYISTGNTSSQFVSGLLFENNNSIGNFFNKNYPTTASTPKSVLQTNKNRGFFKPQKTGILVLDGIRKRFDINTSNLKANTLYYFPDPFLCGNDNFLEFVIDENGITKNQTSGFAKLEPNINQNDTTFHGYTSERFLSNESKYLQNLYDQGYVKDAKRDIYGNLFGLFSNDNNFKLGFEVVEDNTVKSLQLNGHLFYDNFYGEGFAFNYTTVSSTPTNYTIRSGLSAYTGGFTNLSGYYTLFGRYFNPYEELYDPTSNEKTYVYYDGGFLINALSSFSSDLSAFPGINTYYYDTLLEAGVHSSSPLIRALLDASYPRITANLTRNLFPDDTNTFDIDGGLLTDEFVFDYTFKSPEYQFDDTLYCNSEFVIESFDTQSYLERKDMEGVMFVKNIYSGEILPLSSSVPYLSAILSQNVLNSVTTKAKRFEIVGDVICIETDEYFVSFKVGFDGTLFQDPKKSPFVKEINTNSFNRISERYYVDGKIYYNLFDINTTPLSTSPSLTTTTTTGSPFILLSKDLNLSMLCYSIDIENFTEKLFGSENITLSDNNVAYDKMDSPVVAYDKNNKIFNVSALMKDQNYMFDILDITYEISPYSVKYINLHQNNSNSFTNVDTSTLTMLSSDNIATIAPYLLVI